MKSTLLKILERIRNTENIRKVIFGIGMLFSEKILRLLVGFFVTAWVARHLGPEGYGKYTFIIQYVLIFVPIVSFGMNELIARDIVVCKSKDSEGEVLGTATLIKFSNAFIGIALIWGFLPLLSMSESEVRVVIAFSLILLIYPLGAVDHWFEAKVEYRNLVLARNTGYLVGVVAKLYLLVFKESFELFVLTYLLEILLSKAITLFSYIKINGTSHLSWNKVLLKKYYHESLPLFLVSALTIFEQKIGFIFIKSLEIPKILGYYSLSFTIFNILIFIPNAIVTALFPTIISTKLRSESLYHARVVKLFSALFWSSLCGSVLFFFVGGSLFILMFGESYSPSIDILKVFSILLVLVSVDAARKKLFILEGKGRDYFITTIAYVALSLCLQFYFVRIWGAIGIVYGSIVAFMISNILISLFNKNIRSVNLLFIKGFIYPLKILGGK
jgi:O-antigen/teichoic acid export membrane protein